jgi:predicted PurR-regulated permease PerM
VAQVVVAAIAVLGLIYLLKLVLVTTLSAMLLAFILEPLVGRLTRIGIPRAIAACRCCSDGDRRRPGMIRSFITANLSVGLLNAIVSTVVFWLLGIPYFYFLGAISGFVGLSPYLGVFLALLPPLAGGVGVVDKAGALFIFVTVIGLHMVTMNVLYPKIVGKRVRLNPLAVNPVTVVLGLDLGSHGPVAGRATRRCAMKIGCDYVDSLRGVGAWLGE